MNEVTKKDLEEFFQRNQTDYKPTQGKVCIPIINRMVKKMALGIRFDDIKVADGWIIEGHHRYVSSLFADISIGKVPGVRTSATPEHDWTSIEFILEEWDTEHKIKYMNELDAVRNKIPLEEIIEMTK
jgi:Predicted bile acid beta-glucosidase